MTCQNRETLRHVPNKTVQLFSDVTAAEISWKRRELNTFKEWTTHCPTA